MTTTTTEVFEDFNDSTVMDVRLFKFIGLYQILYPSENGSRYHRIVIKLLWLMLVCQSIRVYLSFVHVELAAYFIVTGNLVLLCFYKGKLIMKHRNELRIMLNAARFTFTSCGLKHTDELIQSRRNSRTILRTFTGIGYIVLVIWFARPNLIRTTYFQVDLSESFWAFTFVLDTIAIIISIIIIVIFTNLLVTMCISFSAQFKTITAGYGSLGHSPRTSQPCSSSSDVNIKPDELKLNYDNLIYLIQDNQQIVEKYNEFMDIIRPVIIIKVINNSVALVCFLFICLKTYFSGLPLISAPVIMFFLNFIFMTIELFIYCYVLCHLEESKSEVNFGLYSSNWTEMDIKFKDMLLLTMRMNSANKNIIKITPKNIVNLELFASVMHTNYTVLTVLLNMMKK